MNAPAPSKPPPHQRTQQLARLFTTLTILAILAMEAWQVWLDYRQEFHRAEVSATNVTGAAAEHARDAIRQADALLYDLIEQVEHDGFERLDTARMHRLMKRQQQFLPQLHELFLYDKDGNCLVSDREVGGQPMNNADREYFRYHRDDPDDRVHISQVIRSRFTGDLVIPISRRIDDRNGQFAGVAVATLEVAYFNRFYETFDLGDRGIIVLAEQNGTILVRHPFDPNATGRSLAKTHIVKDLLPEAPAGVTVARSSLDDVERLFSYRQLQDYPLLVETGISTQSIAAPWLNQVARSCLVVVVVIAGLVLFAATLVRQMEQGALAEEELRLAHETLEQLALEDALTGLANRRRLDAVLPIEASRARRLGTPLGIVMLDIDYFKRYNDHYGHLAGDQCIRAVAQVLAGFARRPGDLAARYGGEEMTLLLPNAEPEDTHRIAEQIRQAVRALEIPHSGSDHGVVTVSLGYHVYMPLPLDNTHEAQLLRAADEALYHAKDAGRDRVHPPAS